MDTVTGSIGYGDINIKHDPNCYSTEYMAMDEYGKCYCKLATHPNYDANSK